MATHFSANQYEKEFSPSKLGNWTVPKHFKSRPSHRSKPTKIISNDRGHLLPGIARTYSNPWGNFKGTWDLPDKISKQDAFLINGLGVDGLQFGKLGKQENKKCQADLETKEQHEYTPGDLTDPYQQHPSRGLLLQQKRDKSMNIEPRYELNDLYLEKSISPHNHDKNCHNDEENTPHVLGAGIEPINFEDEMTREVTEKPGERNTTPIIPAFCNFQVAKKMHAENLEHQPLPDSIMDRAYRKLQAQGFANPELALDVYPLATGVGVKTYMAGPTHCTKLKVYRPKTCGVVPKPLDKSKFHDRPHTSGGKIKMGPMDLAICWDYRPIDPRDEPKRPTHIDGSNGSAAPAVFTLVKTPRTPDPEPNTGRSGGVFSNTLGEETFFDKDIMRRNYHFGSKPDLVRTCTCGTSAASWSDANGKEARPRSQCRPDENLRRQHRCKSSPNLSQVANASESISAHADNERLHQCSKHKQRYEHNSRPRKCTKAQRSNRLCEQNVAPVTFAVQRKPEYKSAFKAGIPNSNSSGTCTSFDSGCSSMSSTSCSSKSTLKVPKPRNPYSKKDYVIDTLAPPFACWRGGAGQGGYPEHYRLASVYQHAYKPVEQRKRPLLATVYQ